MSIASETARRRTFAIISHPDAGKTTLTEKLLLFAGAIQIAGSVKAPTIITTVTEPLGRRNNIRCEKRLAGMVEKRSY